MQRCISESVNQFYTIRACHPFAKRSIRKVYNIHHFNCHGSATETEGEGEGIYCQ